MHYTVELLLAGDRKIVTYYKTALTHWAEIINRRGLISDVDTLASFLTSEQSWFEANCGGREIGQEIMAVVGIAQFYSTTDGFTDRIRARRVYKALRRSYCSLEVKSHAKRVAQDYRLLDSDDAS